MAAMDAMDARDAVASLQRFVSWCIQSNWGWWWRWELSWISTTYLGAQQRGHANVLEWSKPLFDAFIAGAWILHWTEDTIYWAAKPTVRLERLENSNRRLHCEDGPTLESDVENLYFWHGVLVPAFVIVRPDWITVEHITQEENTEVRRSMLERMGAERFAKEAKLTVMHEDELHSSFATIPVTDELEPGKRMVVTYRSGSERAQLLRCDSVTDGDDRPLQFVHVTCPSTGREYFLRVSADITRAYEGVASTFRLTEDEYKNGHYLRQGDVMLRPRGPQSLNQQHS